MISSMSRGGPARWDRRAPEDVRFSLGWVRAPGRTEGARTADRCHWRQ